MRGSKGVPGQALAPRETISDQHERRERDRLMIELRHASMNGDALQGADELRSRLGEGCVPEIPPRDADVRTVVEFTFTQARGLESVHELFIGHVHSLKDWRTSRRATANRGPLRDFSFRDEVNDA
jgi:hypothetical protein